MFIIIRIFFLILLAVALVYTFRYMLGGNPRHLKYAIRTLLGVVVLGVLLGLAVLFVPNPPGSSGSDKTPDQSGQTNAVSLVAQMPIDQTLQRRPGRSGIHLTGRHL